MRIKNYFKKMIRISSIIFILLVLLSISFYIFYWFNNRLTLIEAKIYWHQKSFDSQVFKTGKIEERASMIVDIITSNLFINRDIAAIPKLLGKPDGEYYHQDSYYTYKLTNKGSADWNLVFIHNVNGKVTNILIRKACCSISKKIHYLIIDTIEPVFADLIKIKKSLL